MKSRVVAVTPAGRAAYLELLADYVLADSGIAEWQLWDNCRRAEDREFLSRLAKAHPKIRVVQGQDANGGNRSINQFYRTCVDPDTFYIKMDDDLVYLDDDFGGRLCSAAEDTRGGYSWWSPLVVNNAICTWLMKYHSALDIHEKISCQAGDRIALHDPDFAQRLHRLFLDLAGQGAIDRLHPGHHEISLSRFSINCIGFFGADVARLGPDFCPTGVDDEEWISAVLPSREKKNGLVVGDIVVSHFAFYMQEPELLASGLLDEYYALRGKVAPPYEVPRRKLLERVERDLKRRRARARRAAARDVPGERRNGLHSRLSAWR